MASPDKDTIYIDIDDEITGIIDKLQASNGKVVALVLPKRAAVFQSIVNMKLLKRAADSSKKNLVLITSEAGLLPLAGAAGVFVAKTLNSKPEIPAGPQLNDEDESVGEDDELTPEDITAENAGDVPVGELAGVAAVGAIAANKLDKDEVETVELDNDLPTEPTPSSGGSKTFEPPKAKKDKKLKVPNFERFRLLLILGGLLLVVLIAASVYAFKYMPKATVNITTNAVSVDVNQPITLSTTAKKLDLETNTLPAKLQSQQKTYTQQAATTGQKNNGNKASGSVTMSAGSCSGDIPAGVSAGTGVSNNNQTYITQDSVSFIPVIVSGKCIFQGVNSNGQSGIAILAQAGGTAYNVSGVSFAVASRSGITANGSASGGTDSIVQSVNQNDINTAKSKINIDDPAVKKDLENQLSKAGYYPIVETYTSSTPVVTTSAKVGEVANNVTVTESVTYTMFGVFRSDLKRVVEANVKGQIDTSKQSILSDGIAKATFNIDTATATSAQLTMSTVATVGPDLDTNSIRDNAIGKKSGEIKDDLENQPGVKTVTVKFSPFWVSSVPKNKERVTVIIAEPQPAKASDNESSP